MKRFTFKGHHYIWRPAVLAMNIGKLVFALSIGGFYAMAFINALGGLR